MNVNDAIELELRKVKETDWVGNLTFRTLEEALASINLAGLVNSGFYKPKCKRVKGVHGIFMINQNGCLAFDARVIKQDDGIYLIEYMTLSAFNELERRVEDLID